MIALAPIAVVAGEQTINFPNTVVDPVSALVDNESPLSLQVEIGGRQEWLGAWCSKIYDVTGARSIKVVGVAVGSQAQAPSSTLLITLANRGETITDASASLDRAVTVNAGSVSIASGTVSIGNTPTVSITGTPQVTISGVVSVSISSGSVSITGTPNINIQSQSVTVAVALPWAGRGTYTTVGAGAESFTTTAASSNDQTMGLAIQGSGVGLLGIKVVGVQSGTQYVLQGLLTGAFIKGWKSFPINPALDTTYTVSWTSSSGVGLVVTAYSTAHTLGYPNLGQTHMNESIPVVIADDQTTVTVQATPSSGTALASASRGVGTTQTGLALAPGAKGLVVYVNLTAGAGTVTVSILDADPLSGATTSLLTSAAFSGTGVHRLIISPDLVAAANLIAQSVLGGQATIQAVVATAAVTFSVGFGFLL